MNFKTPSIHSNFISQETKNELNRWTIQNYEKSFFHDANMGVERTRLTTRYHKNCSDIIFPNAAIEIQNKLQDILKSNGKSFIVCPNYCHGIVNGIGFEGGDIYEHIDPIYKQNTFTLHCNIISQKSIEGGTTYIDGKKYETNETDLLMYPVSQIRHFVDKIVGNIPRILWVFGFCIEL